MIILTTSRVYGLSRLNKRLLRSRSKKVIDEDLPTALQQLKFSKRYEGSFYRV